MEYMLHAPHFFALHLSKLRNATVCEATQDPPQCFCGWQYLKLCAEMVRRVRYRTFCFKKPSGSAIDK